LHKAYKLSIIYFSLFTLLLLVSAFLLFDLKIGFNAHDALSYYLGDSKQYIPAKTPLGLFKIVLPHIFAFALLSMVLLHFLAFTKFKDHQAVISFIVAVFVIQLLEIFTPFLVLYLSIYFIYFKIASFFLYMLSFILLFALLLYKL